ncbi:family 5 glycoside hydrolase [Phakopsora pachyrhizi]|uniref:glucan 1,3-beta-glucosidase n=1 Tax=Phakopsora pachyrhizi TaxID=170000 RepID=A0AAV0BAR1_PHAPC|nr:family 5 glycoside hydrolase [Phakopsora pachyrhizi]CAH7683674.1 family 5 glycoside hydrolase [Phakopsora pachyrhizi]
MKSITFGFRFFAATVSLNILYDLAAVVSFKLSTQQDEGNLRSLRSRANDEVNLGFNYAKDKIRGVNIGGWLVTEPWVTPTLYDTGNDKIVDEYTFCQYLGRTEATRRLSRHWQTFYTDADFQTIKSYGLNHVRIPIGYWAFEISAGEPYVQGQLEYLKKGIAWAKNAKLNVIIDLHGAPGSQNGFDNSGKRGDIGWADKASNVERTKTVLAAITAEFAKKDYEGVVTGIEALNEPAGFKPDNNLTLNTARQYFKDGYKIVRQPERGAQQTNVLYIVHDAFQPLDTWANSFPYPEYKGVALDTHIYSVFTYPEITFSETVRIENYCRMISRLKASQEKIYTFVGEFAPAPTDCAPRLNGQGIGARFDGTFKNSTRVGSCEGKSGLSQFFSEDYKKYLRKLFEVQTLVYESTSGWVMWTFKAEAADDWSYDAGVKGGWIPAKAGDRFNSVQC